jgi:hypothetical protein
MGLSELYVRMLTVLNEYGMDERHRQRVLQLFRQVWGVEFFSNLVLHLEEKQYPNQEFTVLLNALEIEFHTYDEKWDTCLHSIYTDHQADRAVRYLDAGLMPILLANTVDITRSAKYTGMFIKELIKLSTMRELSTDLLHAQYELCSKLYVQQSKSQKTDDKQDDDKEETKTE